MRSLTPEIDHLRASSSHVTEIKVSGTLTVVVFDHPVDSETGIAIEPSADDFAAMDFLEVVAKIETKFSGDSIFLVLNGAKFAVIRPAFSERPVFYSVSHGQTSLHLWSTREIPDEFIQGSRDFDLDYLNTSLHNWSWLTPRTGFVGISELLSGATLFYDGYNLEQRDFLARSFTQIPTGGILEYDETVSRVRELILNSALHKIGDESDKISIQCSGGVDSSVAAIAAACAFPGKQFPMLHIYSDLDPHADERYYFDAVASHLGWPSVATEINENVSRKHLTADLLAQTARPVKSGAAVPIVAAMKEYAHQNGSKKMLSGDGGDQLFILNDPLLFGREILTESPNPIEAFRWLNELAIASGSNIWVTLSEIVKNNKAKRLREHFLGYNRFARNDLFPRKPLKGVEVVPNGAMLKNRGVSRVFQFFGMRNAELNHVPVKGFAIEERKTFVFWPLIRASFAATRSAHLIHGRDRAIERDAFCKELPSVVYNRFSKGGSRDFLERYDFDAIISSLAGSPLTKYGLISEDIQKMRAQDLTSESAHSLIMARGVADWMELYV